MALDRCAWDAETAALMDQLEREIPLASAMERRALVAFRADLLAALGDADAAREVVDELLAEEAWSRASGTGASAEQRT